jgi:hypothetical protein
LNCLYDSRLAWYIVPALRSSALSLLSIFKMNALDLLFDFAALMSTSSAMTLLPNTNSALDIPAQGPTPKAISNETQMLVSHEDQLQQTIGPQASLHSQLAHNIPSIHHHDDTITAFSRPGANPLLQAPGTWPLVSFPPQHPGIQQRTHLPQQHQLIPFSELDCEFACGLRPSQQCHCAHRSMASACYAFGCAPPWDANQYPLQQPEPVPQQMLHLTGNKLPCECNCEDCYFGQSYHCQYFPPHSYVLKDKWTSVEPRETWGQNQHEAMRWRDNGQDAMGGGAQQY